MSLKSCTLRNILSLDELYTNLAVQLDFPAHFGRNLDALWDVLVHDIEGPVDINWEGEMPLDERLHAAIDLLRDIGQEREDIVIHLPA